MNLSLIIKLFFNFNKFSAILLNSSRIGSFTVDSEIQIDVTKKKLFICIEKPCNYFWYNFLKKKIGLIYINKYFFYFLKFFFKEVSFVNDQSQNFYLLNNKNKILCFEKDEINFCLSALSKINLEKKKIICIHNRDELYLNQNYKFKDWSYHDHRNFSVHSFDSAINFLIKKDYFIFRMGNIANEKIKKNQNYFDYANSNIKNDLLDFYISSKCEFYLGSDSGYWTLPLISRKPIFMINFTEYNNIKKNYNPFFFIPKKIINKSSNRPMSLKEILNINFYDTNKKNVKIIIKDNSEEDILDFVKDYFSLKDNNFNFLNSEDKKIHSEIINIYKKSIKLNGINDRFYIPRIGPSFIKKNLYLLN